MFFLVGYVYLMCLLDNFEIYYFNYTCIFVYNYITFIGSVGGSSNTIIMAMNVLNCTYLVGIYNIIYNMRFVYEICLNLYQLILIVIECR